MFNMDGASREARRMRELAVENRQMAILEVEIDGILEDWRNQQGQPLITTGVPGDAWVVEAAVEQRPPTRPGAHRPIWVLLATVASLSFDPVPEGEPYPRMDVQTSNSESLEQHTEFMEMIQQTIDAGDDEPTATIREV